MKDKEHNNELHTKFINEYQEGLQEARLSKNNLLAAINADKKRGADSPSSPLSYAEENLYNNISKFRFELTESLAGLEDKFKEQFNRYHEIRGIINEEKKSIETLFGIELPANDIEAIKAIRTEKKQALHEELNTIRQRFEDEISNRKAEWKREIDGHIKKRREEEEATEKYIYDLGIRTEKERKQQEESLKALSNQIDLQEAKLKELNNSVNDKQEEIRAQYEKEVQMITQELEEKKKALNEAFELYKAEKNKEEELVDLEIERKREEVNVDFQNYVIQIKQEKEQFAQELEDKKKSLSEELALYKAEKSKEEEALDLEIERKREEVNVDFQNYVIQIKQEKEQLKNDVAEYKESLTTEKDTVSFELTQFIQEIEDKKKEYLADLETYKLSLEEEKREEESRFEDAKQELDRIIATKKAEYDQKILQETNEQYKNLEKVKEEFQKNKVQLGEEFDQYERTIEHKRHVLGATLEQEIIDLKNQKETQEKEYAVFIQDLERKKKINLDAFETSKEALERELRENRAREERELKNLRAHLLNREKQIVAREKELQVKESDVTHLMKKAAKLDEEINNAVKQHEEGLLEKLKAETELEVNKVKALYTQKIKEVRQETLALETQCLENEKTIKSLKLKIKDSDNKIQQLIGQAVSTIDVAESPKPTPQPTRNSLLTGMPKIVRSIKQ